LPRHGAHTSRHHASVLSDHAGDRFGSCGVFPDPPSAGSERVTG